jgi:hypothetical protein
MKIRDLLHGRPLGFACITRVDSVIYDYRYVWSTAELQAKTENDCCVCANVFGLGGHNDFSLAMMESARSGQASPSEFQNMPRLAKSSAETIGSSAPVDGGFPGHTGSPR